MHEPSAPGARCLVTGGLGYAGAWISAHLASRGHTVYVLSRKAEKKDIGRDYTLIRSDLADQDAYEIAASLPEGLDCVIHAASCNEAFEPGYAGRALKVNALGTRNLIRALVSRREGTTPLPLFIYLSTFHVYGRSEGRINEDDPAEPRNDYALTHFFGEEYCRMAARVSGLPVILLRISNCYGAPKTSESDKWYLLLNDLCRMAAERKEILLQSDPATLRDFVWMGDMATVMERLVLRRDLAGRLFNLASGTPFSIGQVAQSVAEEASSRYGKPVPVIHTASVAETQRNGSPELRISNAALCSALDFRFQDRMREEIRQLLALAEERSEDCDA